MISIIIKNSGYYVILTICLGNGRYTFGKSRVTETQNRHWLERGSVLEDAALGQVWMKLLDGPSELHASCPLDLG